MLNVCNSIGNGQCPAASVWAVRTGPTSRRCSTRYCIPAAAGCRHPGGPRHLQPAGWGHRGPSALLNSGVEPATQPPQPESSLEEAAGKRRRNKPVQAWRARAIQLDNTAHKRRKSCLKIEQHGFIISMGFRSSHAQKHSSVISSGGVSWLCAMWSYVMSVMSAPS